MKKILVVTVLLLYLVFCSCTSEEDPPVTDQVVEEVSDVSIEDDIFSEKTDFEVGVSAEVYITAPKAVAPDYGENVELFNQLIQMNADTVKNEYLHDVSIGENSEGAAATSRMMTYEVYTAKDGYISVMLKVTSSVAGTATPNVAYRCISYDLKQGKLLSLADIVGEDKIDTVKALIIEQMKKDPQKYYSTEDDALKDVDITYSFLEKNGKLYIVIGEYTIAPRSEGAQIFEINKGDIA